MAEAANDKRKVAPQVAIMRGLTAGAIVGGALYAGSTVIGSGLSPGWEDLLQGVWGFVGMIVAFVVMRRCFDRAGTT